MMSTIPGTNTKAHLHPFISLRVLHDAVGEQLIPLSTMIESFEVTPTSYVNAEYPVSTAVPTKQVVNGTVEVTEEETDPIIWSVALYSALMFVCFTLAIFFLCCLCKKSKTDDDENEEN